MKFLKNKREKKKKRQNLQGKSVILHAGYFCALYFSRHCNEGSNPGRRLCLDCFVPRNDGEGGRNDGEGDSDE
jgi:hypothetical protein